MSRNATPVKLKESKSAAVRAAPAIDYFWSGGGHPRPGGVRPGFRLRARDSYPTNRDRRGDRRPDDLDRPTGPARAPTAERDRQRDGPPRGGGRDRPDVQFHHRSELTPVPDVALATAEHGRPGAPGHDRRGAGAPRG